ncbi:MAG: 3-hydroxy-3-methylglutaryl-CoA reductase [Planctomycetota bacterium]|nr:3-hydroxy-3-methylglutaryl-CoA reductase [Planctomycetota bacterium]
MSANERNPDRIPRDSLDDYTRDAVEARRALWLKVAGWPAKHIAGEPVDLGEARGKCENLVGFAQIPLGIAGPMRVDTALGMRDVYVPLATTEGALVASYSRGMRLTSASGGIRSRVLAEGLTQNPILVYASAEEAELAARFALSHFDDMKAMVRRTTKHGALVALRPEPIGRRLVLSLVFTTGDAIGINMAANATEIVSQNLAERTGAKERYLHGQDVEKRSNSRAFVEGRGRRAIAEVTVPRAQLLELTRATPEAMVALWRTYTVGFAELGTQNWLVQSANGVAALMLACGQDVAYVVESAVGMLDLEVTSTGDLYASAHMPCLLVGTVGGGSAQGTALECLTLLGCAGAGKANHFAEILAATVLAGDLSLLASFATHEFTAAHEALGRNRPRA